MLSPYPNVVLHEDIIKHPDHANRTYEMHPMLASLLDGLAVKYSQWVFKCSATKRYQDTNRVTIMGFLVFDKGNSVGKVALDTRYHSLRGSELCYKISNERISRSRERGSSTMTANIKHAVKTIESFFTPAPIRERLGELRLAGVSLIERTSSQAYREVRNYAEDLNPHIHRYLRIHKDQFLQELDPEIAKTATQAFEAQDKAMELQGLEEKSKELLTVLIEGDKYVVLHNGNMCVFTQDGLLPDMRQRIGMLKLVEPGQVIPNIGVRVRVDAFMILPPDGFSSEVQP